MRILQATTSLTWSGGTEQCFLLTKYLNEIGYKTDILTYRDSLLDKRALNYIKVYFPGTEKFSIKNAKALARIIEKYDIVNTHIPKAHWYVWLASFFCKKRPKIIYSRRVFYNISFLSSITKYNFHTDAIIVISEEIEKKLKKNPFLKRKKIVFIPSGIELKRFNPETESNFRNLMNIDSNTIIITHVANFQAVKGHDILFKAFQKLSKTIKKKIKLFLVGRDTQSQQALQLISKHNLQNKVIPLGFRKDVPEILKDTDIFVFPSLSEGLGSSLLQAMAMKKIVVASYVGGIKTYLKHMENGIAVEPGSVESLYKGLLTAIENINNEKMKENARKTALNFDIEKVVDKTLKVYKEVLNGIS